MFEPTPQDPGIEPAVRPENRREMSAVMFPPGTQTFSAHVAPPSVETKIGALPDSPDPA